MTTPNLGDITGGGVNTQMSQQLGPGGPVADAEWQTFLKRRKELLDQMIGTGHQAAQQFGMTPPVQPQPTPQPLADPNLRPAARDELIARARFWQIPDPENIDPAQLSQMIEDRRNNVERPAQTTLGSVGLAAAGAAEEAAAATTRLIGNIFGDVKEIPFAGPTLAGLVRSESAKHFMWNLSQQAQTASELSAAAQPKSDLHAYQFLTGAGKMAGYALPAIAAWEALGAAGTYAPVAKWGGRVASPFLRAAIRGGLTGAVLEGGSDESTADKTQNIALGAILGGTSALGGLAAASVGGAVIGAGVGGNIGDTSGERARNAVIGGAAGAVLPLAAPMLAQAFLKVTSDLRDPFQAKFNEVAQVQEPRALLEAGPSRTSAQARVIEEPTLPGGPDYVVHDQPQMGVRSTQDGELVPIPGVDQPTQPALSPIEDIRAQALAPTPERPRLMSPERAQATAALAAAEDQNFGFRKIAARFPESSPDGPMYFDLSPMREGLYGVPPKPQVPVTLGGTKVVDQSGLPKVVYHGTGLEYDDPRISFDPTDGEHLLFGPGYYTTENPGIAEGYAGQIEHTFDLAPGTDPVALGTQMRNFFENARAGTVPGVDPYQAANAANYIRDHMVMWKDQPQALASALMTGIENYVPTENVIQAGEGMLQLTPTRNPNIRPMRLNVQNPFQIEHEYTAPEINDLVDKLAAARPGYDWEATRTQLIERTLQSAWSKGDETVHGETVYFDLAHMTQTSEPTQGISGPDMATSVANPGVAFMSLPQERQFLGRTALNLALKDIGYDGITHIGGARTGNSEHRVWIAFDTNQIHSPWDIAPLDAAEATAQGVQMSKQASVIESASLPDAIGKAKIDDSDVATALEQSNPGGASLLRGVQADQPTIAKMLFEHPDLQFVEREGRLDALVGQVSPKQVSEYRDYGIFSGQEVVTATGVEGTVLNPSSGKRGLVTIQRSSGGPPVMIGRAKVLPGRFSVPQMDVPQLYDQFRADVLRYMNKEGAKADMPPVESMTDPRVGSILPERMDDFFDRRGINDDATRQVLDADFNRRWVEEFKALDPEARAMQNRAVDFQTVAETAREDSNLDIPVSMEEKAQSKGFLWITQPGQGGVLRDLVNPEGALELPMATDQAADAFLENVDRVLPDLTPAGDVPAEVMDAVPTGMNFEPLPTHEDHVASLENALEALRNDTVDIVGGGGGGAGLPPEPPQGSGFFGGQGRIGPPTETLGDQFQALRESDVAKLHRLTEEFTGLIHNKLRYTRYAMLGLESRLTSEGISLGTAWQHYDDLATGKALAFNESHSWIEEWGEIMRQFPRKLLRDGTVTRIHEIEDPAERMHAIGRLADSHGLSVERLNKYVEGDAQITDFMHRWFEHLTGDPAFAVTAEREIFRYMPHVRARQAAGLADPYDVQSLSPDVQFFGEHIRDGQVQLRIMDARQLGNYMIRSAMFKKYEAEPWASLVNAWQDPRIPEGIRNMMLDYAKISRFGYDGSGEVAVRAVKTVLDKTIGLRLTTAEAQQVLNMPIGGMYMSLLAGRTSIFFRDAIQPLMSLAKVETKYLSGVYADVLRGKNQNSVRAMYQRGFDGGWILRDTPAMEAGGIFEEQPDLRAGPLVGLTPKEAAKRELLASIGDEFSRLPTFISNPHNSNLNTLKWYGREQQMNRMITGEAAYRQAKDKLMAYRRSQLEAALQRDPSKAMSYDQLADGAFFSSFEPPIQKKLRSLVEASDDEGAAKLFAREVANWTNFKYGKAESPPILRGGFGRFGATFSSFSGQFIEGQNSAMRNGTPYHKVRNLMVQGGVNAALMGAAALTGWGFNKWIWSKALNYAGGPLLERAARTIEAAIGAQSAMDDRGMSPTQTEAVKETVAGGLMPRVSDFFPYTGYIGSAAELSNAMQGTNPLEQSARYLMTGDRGSGIDFQREMEARVKFEIQQGEANKLGPHPEGSLSPNGGTMQQQTADPNAPPPNWYQQQPSHPGAGALP